MDFQFKSDAENNENTNVENEYHLEIKIESLTLAKLQSSEIQLIFIFGDLVNKMIASDDEGFDKKQQHYIVHSIPSSLSEKLLNMPVMLYVVSLVDSKPLGLFYLVSKHSFSFFFPSGTMMIDVNECFANAVKCSDFRSEAIKKIFDLNDGMENMGKIAFTFSVSKDVGNSNRHRRFYTDSTKQLIKSAKQTA